MAHLEQSSLANAGNTELRWTWLYRIGGVAALIIVLLTIIQVIVYIVSPPPETVTGLFTLFQQNALLGLLAMDLLLMVDYALWGLIYLALYAALRRTSASFMGVATALGLLGVAIYFASNTAFNMLYLSQQYAAATTEAQRVALLAAGEAMLAIYNGTAFQVSYVFLSVAPLIIAIVMLRNPAFGKATAWVGIAGNVLGFGFFVPRIGIPLSLLSVVVLAVWNVLFGSKLLQLGHLGERRLS